MSKRRPLSIIDVDRTDEGVIVTFSNGAVTLFHTDFLLNVRADDGNVSLPPIKMDRPISLSAQDSEFPY